MRKIFKRILWALLIVFVLMNVIAAIHAYKFTHFSATNEERTKDPKQLSFGQKMSALFFGISNPRPVNKKLPQRPFETIKLKSNKEIECWLIEHERSKTDSVRGTVIIFHGYIGEKSSMLDKADEFFALGYNTLLVDFMGSGGSEGNQTTIGYKEAEEVKTCFDYIKGRGAQKIYLFGTSMGAAAVIKALHDYDMQPTGIIVECPFGTMYQTTCARFRQLHAPVIPMAALLDFWGGVENGFNALGYSPAEYAKSVKCPALLIYGAIDDKVSRQETDEIYGNFQGYKQLKIYPLAAHENYLRKYKKEWVADVTAFLNTQLPAL